GKLESEFRLCRNAIDRPIINGNLNFQKNGAHVRIPRLEIPLKKYCLENPIPIGY
ncbi:unnamed protein product, partial [Rotaria magnacalcarata]